MKFEHLIYLNKMYIIVVKNDLRVGDEFQDLLDKNMFTSKITFLSK